MKFASIRDLRNRYYYLANFADEEVRQDAIYHSEVDLDPVVLLMNENELQAYSSRARHDDESILALVKAAHIRPSEIDIVQYYRRILECAPEVESVACLVEAIDRLTTLLDKRYCILSMPVLVSRILWVAGEFDLIDEVANITDVPLLYLTQECIESAKGVRICRHLLEETNLEPYFGFCHMNDALRTFLSTLLSLEPFPFTRDWSRWRDNTSTGLIASLLPQSIAIDLLARVSLNRIERTSFSLPDVDDLRRRLEIRIEMYAQPSSI